VLLVFLLGGLAFVQLGRSPLGLQGQQANAVTDSNAASNTTNTAPAASSQPAKPAAPQTNGKKATPAPKSATAPTSDTNNDSSTAELKVDDVTLDQPTPVCSNQQPAYAVQTAHLTMSTSFHSAGAIHWYWETRVDGGESTDSPPISAQQNTQTVAAGSLPVTFQDDDGTDPLLTAPTSSNYSYSFRLHITAPNEVTSDWVSVPVVLDNSCQPSQ